MSGMDEHMFEGRHAIVTGATRGIGAVVADMLLRRGARVTLIGRSAAALRMRSDTLSQYGTTRVATEVCDITDEGTVQAAFANAIQRFGTPYILVNNAGQSESASFTEMSRTTWDRMIAVNLTGTYLCSAQVVPAMLAARAGRIVNVASTAGLRGYKHTTAYCAAKHGVVGLTRALALETAKHGITVNAVCPGYTATDMADSAIQNLMTNLGKTREEAIAMLTRSMPVGRLIQPNEVADAVVWLCSPYAEAVTGIALPVAGGEIG